MLPPHMVVSNDLYQMHNYFWSTNIAIESQHVLIKLDEYVIQDIHRFIINAVDIKTPSHVRRGPRLNRYAPRVKRARLI
jgi:hypothetical protein